MNELKFTKKRVGNKVEFHKWKKHIITADLITSITILIFLGIVRPDFLVIGVYFLIIPLLIISKRKTLLYHFVLSSAIALCWMIIAKNQYEYNQNFLNIAGINTFPLFAWAIGLFSVYVIYSYFEAIFKERGFIKKIILFCIIFFTLLILGEILGYHVFNIHNNATANFKSLPLCNCLHAPLWMQISYFLLGPVFFIICYLLKLENPHRKKTKIFKNKSLLKITWKE